MKSSELAEVRKTLWAAADQMRANSSLGPAEYRSPVLGLIFLAYAEHRFDQVTPELEEKASKYNPVTPDHYKAKSVLYVPETARLSHLVELPEGENRGKAVDDAMKAIEAANPELKEERVFFVRMNNSTRPMPEAEVENYWNSRSGQPQPANPTLPGPGGGLKES